MITHLERVVPESPGRPDPLPFAPMMQETTREIAFAPDGWTAERKTQMAQLFDGMAAGWAQRAGELRTEPVVDALARGDVPGGIGIEVGSGAGIFTPWLAKQFETLVAVDLSMQMLLHSPVEAAPRVCGDGASLPVRDASSDAVLLINCFLFPAEVDRVLKPHGVLVWANTLGDRTPIHLPADVVAQALPGEWTGVAAEAGWGTWAVLRRR